jgi:RNA polymerase sigma-70 factor (ECF subfamily)
MAPARREAADAHAFVAELATNHSERLRRFLRGRVRNSADIPDIIQEVFLRLLRIPNHETIRVPEAYIFTVAQHVAQQYALRSAASGGAVELSEVLSERQVVVEADPALEITARQCLERLGEALTELSAKAQATFLLYRCDGMSIDEVSERLGISRPMAKKYIVKALAHFRRRLKDAE